MPTKSASGNAVSELFDAQDRLTPEAIEFAVQPISQPRMPTAEAYGSLQELISIFNEKHFDCKLPNVMITFTRRANVLGYFCAEAFRDQRGATAHEIALNPTWFDPHDHVPVFRTIMHEMVHLWRHLHGGPNRKGGMGAPGYHDARWAQKMVEIGLMPSDTGQPGGKRIGFRMSDYMIEGSPFDLTCRELVISGFKLKWRDALVSTGGGTNGPGGPVPPVSGENPKPKNTRTRFICGACELKAWSRASAKLSCNDCNTPLLAR